jgi:hypothetical protein
MAYDYTTAQTYSQLDDVLKEFYEKAIVDLVYHKAPFWAQVKKLPAKGMAGKRVYIPVTTAYSEAVGSKAADDYSLPTPKRSTFDASYIYMKRNYGRVSVDGFSIAATQGKGSWIDIMTAETKNIASAFAMEVDRQTMGRGNGIIGLVASTTGSTITVDDPYGIASLGNDFNLFRPGMRVDAYDVSDSYDIDVDGLYISSISDNTLTMSASTGISDLADGDYITRYNSWSSTAANIGDMMGLDGIVDSGADFGGTNFQGIPVDTVTQWQAYEDSTSQVISETVLQELLDSIEKRSTGEPVNFALTTYALRNKLIDIMRGDRMVTSMNLKAGWKAIKYIGGNIELPIMVHKHCPTKYFYAVSLPHLKFYTLRKLVWDNKGGGIVKPVADYDAYEAWFKMYANLGTDCRNAHGKLTGLTTS